MAAGFTSPAVFGMGDRNEVMDKVDRPDVRPRDPLSEAQRIKAGMSDVEVKAAAPLFIQASQVFEGAQR
jgi:hypothetical protein